MAALREEMLGISLLKISTANFLDRNLCGDGEDWNAAALTVVEAINQMQIPRATTSGTYRQLASEMGLGAGGERRCLLVSYTNPANVLSNANRICNSVERVAGDSIDPFDTGFSQNVNQQLGHCFSRHTNPSLANRYRSRSCNRRAINSRPQTTLHPHRAKPSSRDGVTTHDR